MRAVFDTKLSKIVAAVIVATLFLMFMINLLINLVWAGIIILALSAGYWALNASNFEPRAIIEALVAFFKRQSSHGG